VRSLSFICGQTFLSGSFGPFSPRDMNKIIEFPRFSEKNTCNKLRHALHQLRQRASEPSKLLRQKKNRPGGAHANSLLATNECSEKKLQRPRRESNPRAGLCRPVPQPLDHVVNQSLRLHPNFQEKKGSQNQRQHSPLKGCEQRHVITISSMGPAIKIDSRRIVKAL
jgi:hypothetical protein